MLSSNFAADSRTDSIPVAEKSLASGLPAPLGSAPFQIDVAAELEALKQLDLHELRVRWRKLCRGPVPNHISRPLLLRIVAYKLQAWVHGDLDAETARYLKEITKARAKRLRAGEKRKAKQPSSVPPVPPSLGFKAGTLIGREFNGAMHRVTIVEDGFSWNGETYKSLSEIARIITGTRWNGPRFFGLRKASPEAMAPAANGRTSHVR